jgi:hypothetical protein
MLSKLLLHNVCLALPFPHQELAHIGAADCDPINGWIEGYRADELLEYFQRMDEVDLGQCVQ